MARPIGTAFARASRADGRRMHRLRKKRARLWLAIDRMTLDPATLVKARLLGVGPRTLAAAWIFEKKGGSRHE